ncbi:MAG: MBL fold metallo-hydrolase, partial [Actinomycetota bacterium]|nr:MBL fold metallo-hydrolase [Actinomycetota bacterium]
MKLTVVGCSPAWPNPGGAQSGYLVETSTRVLLDCGPGVLAKLRERESWPHVDAIVITHFHLDHWGDLVPWVWGTMFGFGQDEPAELWLPPGGAARLRHFGIRFGTPDMFHESFRVREYGRDTPFAAGDLDIHPLCLPHYSLETYGLRVSDGARTLVYSGDCGPSERLAELARDADLFICEATLDTPESDGELRGHLSADEAVAAFEASGARRLLVTHRPHE